MIPPLHTYSPLLGFGSLTFFLTYGGATGKGKPRSKPFFFFSHNIEVAGGTSSGANLMKGERASAAGLTWLHIYIALWKSYMASPFPKMLS